MAAAHRSGFLLPLALIAALALVALPLRSTFVPPPQADGAVSTISSQALRGAAAPAAAASYALLAAAVPEPAYAVTEKEWNQFGLVFALFFLGFWVAAFARMMQTGKL